MLLTHLASLSLLSFSVAVPIAHSTSSPASTSLLIPTSHAAAPTPADAYQCPPRKYKSCCRTVEQTSKGIMSGLGEVLPMLSGVQISSQLSIECKTMDPNQAPDTCNGDGHAPMCCNTAAGNEPINMCLPFQEVKEQYYRSLGYGSESQVDMINDAVS